MSLIGIITGSGCSGLVNGIEKTIKTQYGDAVVWIDGEKDICILPRHGKNHSIPPHRINHKANIAALDQLSITKLLSTSAVGSMNKKFPASAVAVPDQFIDLNKFHYTFFDTPTHTDVTEPFCPELRKYLTSAAKKFGLRVAEKGTYVCITGPRYETPAEIKAYTILGADFVGMTVAPEAILCAEKHICYANISIVSNLAAGISKKKLDHEEVERTVVGIKEKLNKMLLAVAEETGKTTCNCGRF